MCFANHMNTVMFSSVEVYAKKKKPQVCLFFLKKRDVKSPIRNKTSAI